MRQIFKNTSLILFLLLFSTLLQAQDKYNKSAGQNAIYEERKDEKSGEIKREKVAADEYGNAQGNQYDLAVDGAFEGNTIAVLQLYSEPRFDFALPKAALKEKGFSVYRWIDNPPTPEELKKALEKSCQLWIISSYSQKLNAGHLKVIKEFFDQGHGVYIWGDNKPYYADANFVAQALLGGVMEGDLPGDKVVGMKAKDTKSGLLPGHLITTGLQFIYEGITIATINPNQNLRPLIYGSEGNLVAAYYNNNGKRAILDGGFTRLYISWDAAGTGRYVKNAAAWLVNIERFEGK